MSMKTRFVLVLAIASATAAAKEASLTNSTNKNESFTCANDHLYDDMDVNEIMGNWKVVELYIHLKNEGVTQYNSCPEITLWEDSEMPSSTFGPSSTENSLFHVQHINAKFRHDYRHLRLLWDEAGQRLQYSLFFRNDSAGYWQVYDGQNGSLASRPNYQQFGGTIQVLKAVNDHLVLNFCQEPSQQGRPAQLYTVLFSRDPGRMARWEIESVHAMLQNKKLSVASRRMVCGNSGDRPVYSILFSLLSCVLAFVVASS